MKKDIAALWRLAEPHVNDAGFDLIEVQFGREQAGSVLRLFIDRPWQPGMPQDGVTPGVSHADCERVSRQLSAVLDVANVIAHAYQLEVSSPGLDRPLRREQDFARFTGRKTHVRTVDPVEGRRNFSGTLLGAAGGTVRIDCDGRTWDLAVADVARASLVPDWDREMKARPAEDGERAEHGVSHE